MSKRDSKGNAGAAEEELDATEVVLPVPVQRRVNALKNLHKAHITLEKQYRDEVAALERKYLALYNPLYAKRSTIVNGEYEPTDAEIKIEGEEPLANAGEKEKDIKGIPKFWLTALKNNSSIADTITPADEGALESLHEIKYAILEGEKQGFSISFHFRENPYFTDSVLTKVYYLIEDEEYNDLVFDRAEGTKINWKPGKNLTVKIVKKQPKGGRGGRGGRRGAAAARATTVEEPCESFFNFFTPPVRPEPSAEEEEDEEEEEENALIDDMLEADFEIGCVFKDKLIPHSVLWFTGEAQEEEYGDEFDYDFGDEDDEDEEDDDDDEEEEEEEEKPKKGRGPPPKKNAGGKGGSLPAPSSKGAPGPQPQQPECKQQ